MPLLSCNNKNKEEVERMQTINLCGKGHCPQVVATEEEVKIGEDGNLVTLKPEEWNALVDHIKEGRIGKL